LAKVFIDGEAGTTGLRLSERLSKRPDVELIHIDERLRKDAETRADCIARADVSFLCLPDESAKEIAEAVKDIDCRIIDCSTAHRTAPGWVYGMPELAGSSKGFSDSVGFIRESDKRVSNPGCHATGFIMAVKPLIDSRFLDPEAELSVYSLTGYSGGGKSMIADFDEYRDTHGEVVRAPMRYALGQAHKHLPEMLKYSGLKSAPVFSPIVCDYYSGMLVSVPLPRSALRTGASAKAVREELAAFYGGNPLVKVRETGYEFSEAAGDGYLSADVFAGRDDIEIFVTGNDDRIEIVSRYDNLGKGASGAAIQNMNVLLGLPEETGLALGD